MLSKFFNSLKPKPYSVQVLRDTTSQSAVKRIKRTRTNAPIKNMVMLTLLLSLAGGGVASASAATAVTSDQAQANVFTDMVCISAEADNAGSWNGGADVYAPVGGRAGSSYFDGMRKVVPSDAAYMGFAGTWGEKVGARSNGEYLTAYEKYGMAYPAYDAWIPVFAEKETTIKQVDSSQGSYSTADGKLTTKGDGNKLQPGDSPLTTTNLGSCMGLLPTITSSIANIIAAPPKLVMGASIELYGNAYGTSISEEGSVLYKIGESIDHLITKPGGLKDTLFLPFMLPLILIGAIWVGYVGIVKRAASQAVQSTVWMIVAIAAGTVFLAQPTLISSFVDTTVATVQKTINEAVLSESGSTELCEIGGSNDSRETIRETECTIWASTIYSTWATGQFGQGVNASEAGQKGDVMTQGAGRSVLNNKDYQIYYGSKNPKTASNWPQFMLDRQVTNKSMEMSEVAWAQLSGADGATINTEWRGSVGMITSAILMFFAAGASSAVLLVYGFALLIYQLTMVTAVLMSPFFFLFGIVPNWGRRVLMRYAEILASLAMKRIFTGAMLAFYLLFYNLIVGDNSFLLLMLKVVLIFALALFFIGARGKFMKMFTDNINFGGNKSIGLPGNKAAALGVGLGAGLLGGGLIGGIMVGNKARKQNKDIEGDVKHMKLEGGNPTADIKPSPKGPNTGSNSNSGEGKSAGQAVQSVVKTGSQAVNAAEDAQKVKSFMDERKGSKTPTTSNNPTSQAGNASTPNASTPNSGNPTPARANPTPARRAATGPRPANAPTPTPSIPTPPVGPSPAAAGIGGAGPTVAPAAAMGTNGVMAGGAAATGGGAAAATGGAAAATGGAAAATGGAAAGSAAAGGAGAAAATAGGAAASGAAAGAAAGSVVPVAGTAVGAVVGAAIVKNVQEKKNNQGEGN